MSQLASTFIDITAQDEQAQTVLARVEKSLLALQKKFADFGKNLFGSISFDTSGLENVFNRVIGRLSGALKIGIRIDDASVRREAGRVSATTKPPPIKVPVLLDTTGA